MINVDAVRAGVQEIGIALRRPEEFTLRWQRRKEGGGPPAVVFPVLIANAVLGLAAYGLVMGMHAGPRAMLSTAVRAPLSAGLAWTIALPALYIVNAALGSRLDASTTFLAALTTVSFGALAMLASVPVAWFFELALPYPAIRVLTHAIVFAGVGVCMSDVFMRVMKALEPQRTRAYAAIWLALVGVIGGELMVLFDVLSPERFGL
jgi:hypothetical protein